MSIQEMIKLWPQYQKWLSDNGINQNNIKDKIPQLVTQLKQDPQKLSQVRELFNNPALPNLAKMVNISDSQLQEMKSMIEDKNTTQGNLTPEQLDMIKRFRR